MRSQRIGFNKIKKMELMQRISERFLHATTKRERFPGSVFLISEQRKRKATCISWKLDAKPGKGCMSHIVQGVSSY